MKPHTIFLIACLILTTVLFAYQSQSALIRTDNAWLRESPPTINHLAGYLRITNNATHPKILIGAESTDFEYIEIHLSQIKQGIATMQQQQQIRIPPTTTFTLKPGGYHLMLFNPRSAMPIGTASKLTLIFKNGDTHNFTSVVKKFSDNDTTSANH